MQRTSYTNPEMLGGRRRQKKKISRTVRWSLIILGGGISALGIWYGIIESGLCKVKEISIEGIHTSSKEKILRVLTTEMIGMHWWRAWMGQDNMLFWKLGSMPNLVANLLPEIKTMEKKINLLNKKVVLTMHEREIMGIWCKRGEERCKGFDSEGEAFVSVPSAGGMLILKINDENEKQLQEGTRVLLRKEWFEMMMKTIKDLKDQGFVLREINVKNQALREWDSVLKDGPTLYFTMGNYRENIGEIINRIKKETKFSMLRYIDFRVENRVYYK